jgi:predicted DNA-binding ribbon-helix-helix protein
LSQNDEDCPLVDDDYTEHDKTLSNFGANDDGGYDHNSKDEEKLTRQSKHKRVGFQTIVGEQVIEQQDSAGKVREGNISVKCTKTTSGMTGLCNLVNTCFMNAALQCLVHSTQLADFFLSEIFLSDENLGHSFAELIDNIYQSRYSTYSPDSFLREFTANNVAPQFRDREQRKCFTLLYGIVMHFVSSY